MMDSPDPQNWKRVDDVSGLKLPKGGPRVLLFLHGTFSSTAGSFGLLGLSDWGQEFLKAASEQYDAVIGYDHATLSSDPRDNARDLVKRLRDHGKGTIELDVVGYSRGGLVFRSLLRDVLPGSGWAPQFGSVVFVAVPNGGTQLAKPDNWYALVDLFTTLSNISCRTLKLLARLARAGIDQ